MKVFYIKQAEWEIDFFKNDLFHGISHEFILFDGKYILSLINDSNKIVNTCLVVNDTILFSDVLTVVKEIKPKIVFHLSDERGNIPEWGSLENHTIYVRQYNHYNCKNIMPLGYAKTMLNGIYSLDIPRTKIKDRKYDWSFIGSIKSDRIDMFNNFTKEFPNYFVDCGINPWNISSLNISPQKMGEIYNNSVFVPIGSGNWSLDCFRFYEAIIMGAIPVIVGCSEEIKKTYFIHQIKPLFIYSNDWNSAAFKCKQITQKELQIMQDSNYNWWKSEIENIQNLIKQNC